MSSDSEGEYSSSSSSPPAERPVEYPQTLLLYTGDGSAPPNGKYHYSIPETSPRFNEDERMRWLWLGRAPTFEIVHVEQEGGNVQRVGSCECWEIEGGEISSTFGGEWAGRETYLDEEEHVPFVASLFDARGFLKRKHERAGTGVWAPWPPEAVEEDWDGSMGGGRLSAENQMFFIRSLDLQPEFQEQEGEWVKKVVEMLWSKTREDFIYTCPKPDPVPAARGMTPEVAQAIALMLASASPQAPTPNNASVAAYRSASFRRIGYTPYFAIARDEDHPSRRWPARSDLNP